MGTTSGDLEPTMPSSARPAAAGPTSDTAAAPEAAPGLPSPPPSVSAAPGSPEPARGPTSQPPPAPAAATSSKGKEKEREKEREKEKGTNSPPPAAEQPAATSPLGGGAADTNIIEPARPDEQVTDESEFDPIEGYESDGQSSTGSTSATSSVYAHTIENGRRYHHFKNGRYPIPNDEDELNREDMKHAMLLELTNGELFYAPVSNLQSVLDVGTGTGIWAIDVGDRYPTAKVRGIDLSPTQPRWMPPNVDFLVDDCEQHDWISRDVDLVHLRFMTPVLKNVAGVLASAFQTLRPGGWIELQELYGVPLCDDGTMPPDDPFAHMYALVRTAFGRFGMNPLLVRELGGLLRAAGYQNIQLIIKKVPIGTWARDKTMRLIGMYQKMAVLDLLPAFAGRPFGALGIGNVEGQVILAHARRALEDNAVHRYFEYYFWYAQRPEGSSVA